MYNVKEIFLTKQGEGYHTGRDSIFIRFSGCNLWSGLEKHRYRAICNWCDTDFVGTDGINGGQYTKKEIVNIMQKLWPENYSENPFIVCTGGEPLLQLDQNLVDEMHESGFEIAIETNGTYLPPENIDWICVSPKKNTELLLKFGDELKFVYPQPNFDPKTFEKYDFDHYYIQPMDGNNYNKNEKISKEFINDNPNWKLSLQTHKILGFP
ncbi:MAG: 7-carboxy-7-deazaguanine synthase [Candidatus Marinimicrobia bacterium]|nr:7-carboxy-7-deazaguanine synthase [Candidatus Neomarinimicrobiota bacterium]